MINKKFFYLNYKNDTFIPIQDWNIEYSSTMLGSSIKKKNDILIVHNYNFNLNNFDQIYFWDFFNNKMHKITKESNIALQINKIRNNRNCSLETDYKLKAKNDKNNLIELLQIKNFNFLKKN